MKGPQPPAGPHPPAGGRYYGQTEPVARVAVLEHPESLPAQCVVLDEYLTPQELDELIKYTLEHESDSVRVRSFLRMQTREPPTTTIGDRVSCWNWESFKTLVVEGIQSVLPLVIQKLGMEPFAISRVEAQITGSNDGDFFRGHSDTAMKKSPPVN